MKIGEVHTFAFKEGKSILRHARAYVHFPVWRWGVEWNLFGSNFAHAYVECSRNGDHLVTVSVAVPWLFALWVHVEVNKREHWLRRLVKRIVPDDYSGERKCGVSFFGWTLHVDPWVKTMESVTGDSWLVRGWSLDVKDFILGRAKYEWAEGDPIPVAIALDGKHYHGRFKPTTQTWKRPRWFRYTRHGSTIEMAHPIPIPGKGENSWDCGDDAVVSRGFTTDDPRIACAEMIQGVLETRQRYGGRNWAPSA